MSNETTPSPHVDQTTQEPELMFPEPVILRPCSANQCSAGHTWDPVVAVAKCGYGSPQGWVGCGSPILAIKMTNCPVCNEPPVVFRMRTDHTGPARYPIPLCIPGSTSTAEVGEIILERRHYVMEENKSPETDIILPEVNKE